MSEEQTVQEPQLTDDEQFQQELAEEYADTPYYKAISEETAETKEPPDTELEAELPVDTPEVDAEGSVPKDTETDETGSPDDTTDYKAELGKLQNKFSSLDGLFKQRMAEMDGLRQKSAEYDQFAALLQTNPIQYLNNVGQPQQPPQDQQFDFTDPNAIQEMVKAGVRAELQQQEDQKKQQAQANNMRRMQSALNAERQRLVAEGSLTEADIAKHQAGLARMMSEGTLFTTLHQLEQMPQMIAAAKKAGADEAIKGLKTKTNIPPSLSKTTATPRQTTPSNSFDSLTADQMQNVFKGFKPGDDMTKFVAAYDKKMKSG